MDDDNPDYTNKDSPLDDSKITVSKRVKSLSQLTLIEKEIVKLMQRRSSSSSSSSSIKMPNYGGYAKIHSLKNQDIH
jgi:hypothetical protein